MGKSVREVAAGVDSIGNQDEYANKGYIWPIEY